jgi:hypothetical protein
MSTRFLTEHAIGGDVTVQLPANVSILRDFEIHEIYVKYTAVGPPAGARVIRLTMEDPNGHVHAITGGDEQPVGQVRHYMAFSGAPLDRVPSGDDIQWLPWPPTAVVPPGTVIRARNVSGVATPNDLVDLHVQYDASIENRGN